VTGNENQPIGEMKGGTAIGKIVGNVIYNYYYREEVKTAIDVPAVSADADLLPCPYRGLFHFGPGDAEYFFGREGFVEELVRATQTRNFIPLLGASGSGKSSVVLAGLVPKLQQAGHWQFTHFRPGSDPFYALAEALVPLYMSELDSTDKITQAEKLAESLKNGTPLARIFSSIQRQHPNDRVLLIADQFEELYTLCTDETTRRNFLDRLLAGIAAPADLIPFAPLLVATMRADFLGNALSYRPFADVLKNDDLKLLEPMSEAELTEAIEKPAQKLGVTFEAGLVERILGDAGLVEHILGNVEQEPGILPLLEFALTELWQRRSGKQLTHAAYEEIGEVKGALGRHADREYERLSDVDRERVQRILVQLVRPGEGAEDTRRIAIKAELGEHNWALVKQLADARLVVTSRNGTSQETVEVVHEALIRNWGELQGWMDIDRVFRAWQERLRAAKGQWEATNQDPGSLLRGAALAKAEEELKERPEDLIDEKKFIEQSIQERDRLKQAEIAHRKREIKTARVITAGSLIAVVVSSGLGLMVFNAYQKSEEWRQNTIIGITNNSLLLMDLDRKFNGLIEALKVGRELNGDHKNAINSKTKIKILLALEKGLYGNGNDFKEVNRFSRHLNDVNFVMFSPDGSTIASASRDKTVILWTPKGEFLKSLPHDTEVKSVSFSPDGKIASASNKIVKLWSSEGKLLKTLPHEDWVNSVSFSPDGKIASASNKIVKLWSSEGKLLKTLPHPQWVNSVSFSPNRQMIASAGQDNVIRLWDMKGVLKQKLPQEGDVTSVSFSPDSQTIVSSNRNKTIQLWKRESDSFLIMLKHGAAINSVSFSPDHQMIASAGQDKNVMLWSSEGNFIRKLPHNDEVTSVSFSKDSQIASASKNIVTLWSSEGQFIRKLPHKDKVTSVSYSPNGQMLASVSIDRTITLWSNQGQFIKKFPPKDMHKSNNPDPKMITSVAFSIDSKIIASAGLDNTVRLLTLDGELNPNLNLTHTDIVNSIAISRDGKMIASAGDDKIVKIWRIDSGQLLHTLPHEASLRSVTFSPDSKKIATGSLDKKVYLWSIEGELLKTISGQNNDISAVAFSSDNKKIASASLDGTVILWDLENLELKNMIDRSCDLLGNYFKYNYNQQFENSKQQLCLNHSGTGKLLK
jgi:WD40 repeat protein